MNLSNLNDQNLLSNTKNLVQKEREILSQVLEHLQEIARRRLYSDLGCSSLFDYCTKELKYSPAQAYRRIDAMRVSIRLPQIKKAQGKCQKCGSTHNLEFEHRVPFARGGTNDISNIQLYCKNCNTRKAILDFGQEKMDKYLSWEKNRSKTN
jgi:RNase P subunit RPR2